MARPARTEAVADAALPARSWRDYALAVLMALFFALLRGE